MRTEIVVQNVASFRIDPAVLARRDRRLVLITSPLNRQRLRRRGRENVFGEIHSIESFAAADLTATVAGIRDRLPVRDRDDIRLLCHDEYSLDAVARVRSALDIPGDRPHQVAAFVDKLVMKHRLDDAGVRLPRHLAWDEAAYRADPDRYVASVVATVGLPAFVKPVNESGSVGTRRIGTGPELARWAAEHDTGVFEVDEFIDGTLYHVDTALQDGVVVHVAVNEYLYPCYDYLSGKVNCSWTVPAGHPEQARLIEFNQRVLDALVDKPGRGVFHHEIFRTIDGELVFLEIAARAPAAFVPFTSQIRYGLNIEEALFRLQRGEQLTWPEPAGPYAAWVFYPKPAGVVIALDQPDIVSDHDFAWNVDLGENLGAATDIRDFGASVLLWNPDFDGLKEDLDRLDKHIPVVTTRSDSRQGVRHA